MSLDQDKALQVISCLIEGCSIRSTERLTGVDRNTIMRLLEIAGRKCEALMRYRIQGLKINYAQCDEVWSWVAMKQKTKTAKASTPTRSAMLGRSLVLIRNRNSSLLGTSGIEAMKIR